MHNYKNDYESLTLMINNPIAMNQLIVLIMERFPKDFRTTPRTTPRKRLPRKGLPKDFPRYHAHAARCSWLRHEFVPLSRHEFVRIGR